MKKILIAAAASVAATSAFAYTAVVSSEYYVARDATTKKCTIVDNGTYKTRTEAESGMKATKVCTEN